MKTRTFKRKLITGLLALSLTLGMPGTHSLREAQADRGEDIDSVMNELDSDFQFGGKEDFKRSQMQSVNEQLREDIQIKRDEELSANGTIVFSITELGAPTGNNLKVTFPATIAMGITGPVLINGLDGATVVKNINIPLGEALQLVVQCLSVIACDFNVTIISGGSFSGLGASTGNQMLAASSGLAVFSVIGL